MNGKSLGKCVGEMQVQGSTKGKEISKPPRIQGRTNTNKNKNL